MFSLKTREKAAPRNPLEGRLLDGRSVESSPNLMDHCQNALNDGSYLMLANAFPLGVVARLNLQDGSYVAAIALDSDSQGATIYSLHQTEGRYEEVARQMVATIFNPA